MNKQSDKEGAKGLGPQGPWADPAAAFWSTFRLGPLSGRWLVLVLGGAERAENRARLGWLVCVRVRIRALAH